MSAQALKNFEIQLKVYTMKRRKWLLSDSVLDLKAYLCLLLQVYKQLNKQTWSAIFVLIASYLQSLK